MKKVTRRITTFGCSTCKTEYDKVSDAQICKKRVLEVKAFAKGDRVSNIEQRTCSVYDKNYVFKGRVVRIVGPMASDYEYEVKWLGAVPERINGHVFHYQVRFTCPHCKEVLEERYFAPELKKIR